MTAPVSTTYSGFVDESDCRLDDFRAQVQRGTDLAAYPLAADVRRNVLIYSAATVAAADRRALQSELIHALADGPGVVVFEGAFPPDVVDAASDAVDAASDAIDAGVDAASDVADDALDAASDFAEDAGDVAEDVGDFINPF